MRDSSRISRDPGDSASAAAADTTISSKLMRNELSKSIKSGQHTNAIRQKASRLVLLIILFFFIQWTPLCVFQLFVIYTSEYISNIQYINVMVSTMSYSNTVANPFLYMIVTYNFRAYWKKKLLSNHMTTLSTQMWSIWLLENIVNIKLTLWKWEHIWVKMKYNGDIFNFYLKKPTFT